MNTLPPTIFIIVGATCDVSRRLVLPALAVLREHEALPVFFETIQTSRKDVPGYLRLLDSNDAHELAREVQSIEERHKQGCQVIAYLAVPPEGVLEMARLLGESGVVSRILLEKPFGTDEESARELSTELSYFFTPSQIVRVDHYLAKRVVAECSAYLGQIQGDVRVIDIHIYESIGVEGRAVFYEATGALRDMVQSHALLVGAELYASAYDISRTEALERIAPIETIVRAQYSGYTHDVGNEESLTETFVSLETKIGDTLLRITTGKALDHKETSVTLTTGYGEHIETKVFRDSPYETWQPLGYQKVLLDSMNPEQGGGGITETEIELLWRRIDPLVADWKRETQIATYSKGSTAQEVLTNI